MKKKWRVVLALMFCAGVSITSLAGASIIVSLDTNDFNLVLEEFTYTPFGTLDNLNSFSGNMSLDNAAGIGDPVTTTHFFSDFAGSVFSGNVYALSGDENFDVLFSSTQTAFAFSYEDDADISTFTLEFFNDATSVGNSSFISSTFNTEQFLGFISDTPFNKVTIRENDGSSNSNEYFQLYSAEVVPEPATAGTLVLSGLLIAAYRRIRKNYGC